MAKGSPTADANANFGVGAAPAKATGPNILPGASLTKAPKGNASGAGWWAPNDKLPQGVTAEWVPPSASPVTGTGAATPRSPRDIWATLLARESNGLLGTGMVRGNTSDGGQRERMDSASYGGRSVGRSGGGGLY